MNSPRSLTSMLDRTLTAYGLKENAERYEALTHWTEIVGEQIASVSVPERIKDTTLVVKVESSVWKYELTMRSQEILAKIRAFTSSDAISTIMWH